MTVETTYGAVANGGPATAAELIGGGAVMTATSRAEVGRAMAEVMAQVQVAQAVPRNLKLARQRIENSCQQFRFAKAASYSFKRGGHTITGPTIKLIREIAAAFGNFQWGLVEVDRDPVRGYSMMMAWAWDVQTNARNSTTFMVRAVRDLAPEEEGGDRRKVPLLDERDIYENNANMGSRRVRSMIQATLPAWLVEEAEEWCRETIVKGPVNPKTGKPDPLEVRLSNAVDMFAAAYQVRLEQLEEFAGAPFGKWGPHDLVQLITLYESLGRGDIRRDEVFTPRGAVSAADVSAQAGGNGNETEGEPGLLSDATRLEIDRLFTELGWGGQGNRARRQRVAGHLAAQEHDDVPAPVRRWADLNEAHGQAALAGLRRIFTEVDADGRTARLEELDAEARQAAATPDDGDRPATTETLGALANRFAEGERDGAEHADLRGAVTAMAVHGHWADLGEITEAQARYAIGRIDASFADARRRDEALPVRLDRMYAAAIRERDRAEHGDDDGERSGDGREGEGGTPDG